MPLSEGTKDIVKGFGEVIEALNRGFESRNKLNRFLLQFGWSVPVTDAELATFNSILTFRTALDQLIQLGDSLLDDSVDEFEVLEELATIAKSIYEEVKNIDIPANSIGMPYPFSENEFWEQIKEELAGYLIHSYIQEEHSSWYSILSFLGILDETLVWPNGLVGHEQSMDESLYANKRTPYIEKRVEWSRIGTLVSSPKDLFAEVYNWGGHGFQHRKFLQRVKALCDAAKIPAVIKMPESSILNEYYASDNHENKYARVLEIPILNLPSDNWDSIAQLGIMIMPIPKFEGMHIMHGHAPSGFMITPLVRGSLAGSIQPNDFTTVSFFGDFEADGFFRFNVLPSDNSIDIDPGQVTLSGGIDVEIKPEEPWKIIGSPEGGFYIQLEGAYASAAVQGPVIDPEFIFKIGTSKDDTPGQTTLVFGINFADGDGFISKIFAGKQQEIKIGGRLVWSSKEGFSIDGNIGFRIHLISHLELGPLSLIDMNLELGTSGDNAGLIFGTDVSLELGPFTALVEQIGLSVEMENKESSGGGIFGDLDFDFGFKPPTGIGFSIDASAFKGGGFLSFDFEEERYVGALELSIKDKVSLKVIGVLTTKLPGNPDGYSLLLLITAEFEPLNLGFGFTLNGVGGLIALNRTMNLNYLRDGVKANTLDNILFPTDPIENINQIISDLEGAFPIEEGRYAFGPMAIIGWGTPTLITVELGLMIEVPSPVRLAVLGVLKAVLPTEEKSLLKFQVNFLGTIDFEAKYITFDASIFASKLLTFTLEGDMAFRLKWGDSPNFLFSIGGFHPSYTPPPLDLPSLNRLTINLLGGDNPRLTLTSYFAVTSNTVQFGSAVDFYYRITDKYSVIGYLGFDILIQFNPFYLIASIAAQLAVMKNNEAVLNIYLGASISGPAPWHVQGTAEFKVFGIKLKVNFDKTFGQPETTTLPNVDVLPKLIEAIENKANWQAINSNNSNLLVTLRELDNAPGDVVAHPYGSIGVSQKVVPLDMTINKFGTQRPADYQNFSLDIADAGGTNFPEENVQDFFAPAEYLELSDSSKLSRKSFEEFNSGVSIKGGDEIKSSYLMERELEYEQIVMDSRNAPEPAVLVKETALRFNAFRKNGSAAKSKLGTKSKPKSENAPPKVSVKQEKFAIANVDDLTQYGGMEAGSEAEARVMLEELLNGNPALEDSIQVVPFYEVA